MKPAEKRLLQMFSKSEWISLKLYPEIGNTVISKEPVNRLFINDGADGYFDGISEAYYDKLVNKYHHQVGLDTNGKLIAAAKQFMETQKVLITIVNHPHDSYIEGFDLEGAVKVILSNPEIIVR